MEPKLVAAITASGLVSAGFLHMPRKRREVNRRNKVITRFDRLALVSLEEDSDFPFCLVGSSNMRPESFVARLANSHCQCRPRLFDVKTFRGHGSLP